MTLHILCNVSMHPPAAFADKEVHFMLSLYCFFVHNQFNILRKASIFIVVDVYFSSLVSKKAKKNSQYLSLYLVKFSKMFNLVWQRLKLKEKLCLFLSFFFIFWMLTFKFLNNPTRLTLLLATILNYWVTVILSYFAESTSFWRVTCPTEHLPQVIHDSTYTDRGGASGQ